MNKNILKISLFIIIFVLISLIFDQYFSSKIKQFKYGETREWLNTLEGNIEAHTLIMGDSRAETGINCRQVQKWTNNSCLNISTNGNRVDIQKARFKMFLENNPPSKIFVHVLGISSLGRSKPYDPIQFLPVLTHEELYQTLKKTQNGSLFVKARYIPLYGPMITTAYPGLNITKFFQPNPQGKRDLGYWPVHLSWNESGHWRKKFPDGIDILWSSKDISDLTDMINMCKKNNIQYILVLFPLYKEAQQDVKNYDQYLNLLHEISEKEGVPFLNYYDHEVCQNKDYFFDYQHLNYKGADVFSDILGQDINKILEK